jgi:hypothetical protein
MARIAPVSSVFSASTPGRRPIWQTRCEEPHGDQCRDKPGKWPQSIDPGSGGYATNRMIACLNLSKGPQAAKNLVDIQQILMARPFQGLGLGSRLIDGFIELAVEDILYWLKVEIVTDMKAIMKSFRQIISEIQTIIDDYFVV